MTATTTLTTGKTVKLETPDGELLVVGIEEYVCGFAFFYVRHIDGRTASFSRSDILAAYRRLPTGEFRQIHLKKPKIHEEGSEE
jgi:hypothetical protein